MLRSRARACGFYDVEFKRVVRAASWRHFGAATTQQQVVRTNDNSSARVAQRIIAVSVQNRPPQLSGFRASCMHINLLLSASERTSECFSRRLRRCKQIHMASERAILAGIVALTF